MPIVSNKGQGKKGSQERKLRKLLEQKKRLKEDLELERIPVSQACQSLIKYTQTTRDYFVPSVWGNPPVDPFASQSTGTCGCVVM
ncbi:hypothetical protein H4219_000476 [Mycoemilia scoparia]|uniref:Guanine nucleotide-binding protein subunit gamma n=1 Tax=Mycoemilia scoparia TaxID=417184 RepID=A0A9W8A8H7_9FUNG|nr:hypothetical protein H4219_000476 [Mycoemilia scoparia]